MDELKETYIKLAQKYRLPDYDALSRECDMEDIEKSSFLLTKIRIRIIEMIDEQLKIIEGVLQPDVNLSNLCESRHITEEQKEVAYQNFKALMMLYRQSNEISLINTEEKNAEFIRDFYSKWQEIKKELKILYSILKESWKIETSIKEDLSYLG
ncbi:MAG: hypothetical protein V1859_02760 [archaeon]